MKKIRSFFKWNKVSDLWKQERYINLGTVEDPFAHFYWNKNPKYTYITLNNEGEIEWEYKFEFGNWVKHYCLNGIVWYVEVPEGKQSYLFTTFPKGYKFYVNGILHTQRKYFPSGSYELRVVSENPKSTYSAKPNGNNLKVLGQYFGKDVTTKSSYSMISEIKELVFSNNQTSIEIPAYLNNLKSLIIPSGVENISMPFGGSKVGEYDLSIIQLQNNDNFYIDSNYLINKKTKTLHISKTSYIPNDILCIDYGALPKNIDILTLPENIEILRTQSVETINVLNYNCIKIIRDKQYQPFFPNTIIQTINIGKNVESIPEDAFLNSQGFTTLTIPENVKEIGYRTFYGNLDLKSIYIGKNLNAVNKSLQDICLFANHPSLETIIVDKNNINLESVNNNTLILKTSASGRWIAKGTKNTIIPTDDDITYLMPDSFSNSNIESIIIPKNITYIGQYCFGYNNLLQSITLLSTNPPYVAYDSFEDCPNITIYVPTEAVNTYKKNVYWKKYADKIQPIQ